MSHKGLTPHENFAESIIYTPGPWFAIEDRNGSNCDAIVKTQDFRIAHVGRADSRVAQANARLIAAAPDLLEALKTLLPLAVAAIAFVDCKDQVNKASKAIAKAEGK